jgi:Mg-chelatase subunit ChlD
MASLINALDNYTPTQTGENGHLEYGWSNSIQEKIVQLNFQLIRTSNLNTIEKQLADILKTLNHTIKTGSPSEKNSAKEYLSILYRMIGYTRDIIDGKGEYNLTYMMIYNWNLFYPELARYAVKCLVDSENKSVHQYGSWKDIKYFCQYCNDRCFGNNTRDLTLYAIELTNDQLRRDHTSFISNSDDISLAAKWIPREKSRFAWLFELMATRFFNNYMLTAGTESSRQKAVLKCKTDYRKLLSILNRKIDTIQIKQCEKKWASIDFSKTTSITFTKQKKAFLNVKKDGTPRYPQDVDRVECADNFNEHIKKAITTKTEIKGKRVSMADFTKTTIDLLRNGSQIEKDLINSQWRNSSTQTGALGNMIAMVDVSGSMDGDPMNVAIALGIRIAEKSALGKRVMTFSSNPTWVNLEPYSDFVSQVEQIKKADWGMNTNFHAALDMILDAIIQNKMAPEDVENLVLVILSDMQMDNGDKCNKQVLYDTMKDKYNAAGIRVHGKGYKPPHILFWNLRSTSGFPSLSYHLNTSMISGFSPAMLNMFCEQGLTALNSYTPWSTLIKSLENERYAIMGIKINQEINV